MSEQNDMMQEPRLSVGARFILLSVAMLSIAAALVLVFRVGQQATLSSKIAPPSADAPTPAPADARVKIGVAYGTEKRGWLEDAARQFASTPDGQQIDVQLIPLGSLQAAQRIWQKDITINVWSPASALYKDVFVQEWKSQNNGVDPISSEESLALTPMVFVMWEERYQAFVKKYPELSFTTLAQAMQEKSGWDAIAGKPDWMFFKFSHTDPNESNSGLMTLVLMAYDHFGKSRGLGGRELTDAHFQASAESIESGLVQSIGSLSNSTGNLMDDMVRKGPSTYDAIFVYESVAIDQLRHAEGRWDKLRVIYPRYNMWSDNPYYILNVPWSKPAQREAAEKFRTFLLSEPVQAQAMTHGFRPANTSVMTRAPDSPFTKFADRGLRPDLPGAMCEPPPAEVINGLLTHWQQMRGTR